MGVLPTTRRHAPAFHIQSLSQHRTKSLERDKTLQTWTGKDGARPHGHRGADHDLLRDEEMIEGSG